MRRDKNPNETILGDAVDEVKDMAREGLDHPSSKPVLKGAAIGAVAGAILPVVTLPVGLAAGAVFMLYKRIRP